MSYSIVLVVLIRLLYSYSKYLLKFANFVFTAKYVDFNISVWPFFCQYYRGVVRFVRSFCISDYFNAELVRKDYFRYVIGACAPISSGHLGDANFLGQSQATLSGYAVTRGRNSSAQSRQLTALVLPIYYVSRVLRGSSLWYSNECMFLMFWLLLDVWG